MRRITLLSFCLLSWLPWTAHATGMGYDDARHLLLRTGFAPSQAEVRAYATLSRAQAVDRLLVEPASGARTPPPEWVGEPFVSPRTFKNASAEERKALRRREIERGIALRAWWYQEMLTTPMPLGERMTLFWHNHFVSSQQKVKSAQLMYRQNILLRQHALGNFATLLHAVAKDPAMIVYLDSATNRRGRPNENFAREVMELFTLGEGHYAEQDIKEAARAFTGWGLDRDSGEFRFYRALHDPGRKTILGRSGTYDGDAVLDILLEQPQTAELISAKLWREFVSPTPDSREIKRLATIFRDSRYEIKPLLRALFMSDAFFAPDNRAVLVKSPVELLVGTLRQFGIENADARVLVFSARQLDQDLFGPPNVKGWPGGNAWINSSTLLARKQFLERVFRDQEMQRPSGGRFMLRPGAGNGERRAMRAQAALASLNFDAARFLAAFPDSPAAQQTAVARLLLASVPARIMATNEPIDFVRELVLDPKYQLK